MFLLFRFTNSVPMWGQYDGLAEGNADRVAQENMYQM